MLSSLLAPTGIITLTLLLITFILGLLKHRLGMRWNLFHRIAATVTVLSALSHGGLVFYTSHAEEWFPPPKEDVSVAVESYQQVSKILKRDCAACHEWVNRYEDLMKFVVAKNPAKSEIFHEIIEDKMPPSENKLSCVDKIIIQDWIQEGAPMKKE